MRQLTTAGRTTTRGRNCARCKTWYPWSAYAPGSNGKRKPRCYWCDYQRASSKRGPLLSTQTIAMTRACLEPHGKTMCGGCGRIRESHQVHSNGRGGKECVYCSRAGLFRRKGVSNADAAALERAYIQQGGACACCERHISIRTDERDPAHAHHCHTTMRFVCWLCRECNHLEGLVRDSEHARKLAAFLDRHSGGTPKDAPA